MKKRLRIVREWDVRIPALPKSAFDHSKGYVSLNKLKNHRDQYFSGPTVRVNELLLMGFAAVKIFIMFLMFQTLCFSFDLGSFSASSDQNSAPADPGIHSVTAHI